VPFELFVIGKYIGATNEFDVAEPLAKFATLDQLIEMSGSGGRIQWHSYSHERMSSLSGEALRREVIVPEGLKRQLRPDVDLTWFAYPHGDFTSEAVDIVKEHYRGACSVQACLDDDNYSLKRDEVWDNTTFKLSTVSVIIPNYNYGRFIGEAIESVYSQTVRPDEVLVIDDCSTDDSRDVIKKLSGKYDFNVEFNEKNLGIVNNFNKAVSLTNGDYVSFLGADNRYRADYIGRCKEIISRDAEVAVAYTDIMIFGPQAFKLATAVGAELFHFSGIEGYGYYYWKFPTAENVTYKSMTMKNDIHGSSMFRRKAFEQVGGYVASGKPEDHDFFTRILSLGWKPAHVADPVLYYRQHSPSQANTVLNLTKENISLKNDYIQLKTKYDLLCNQLIQRT
jgi:glycosyltransferase involved in cell wall biosynthesis